MQLFWRTLTECRALLISKPCINCGMLIQKNGGCQHVRCARCKFEMCWLCDESYIGYKHEPEQEGRVLCQMKQSASLPYRLMLIFTLLAKFTKVLFWPLIQSCFRFLVWIDPYCFGLISHLLLLLSAFCVSALLSFVFVVGCILIDETIRQRMSNPGLRNKLLNITSIFLIATGVLTLFVVWLYLAQLWDFAERILYM